MDSPSPFKTGVLDSWNDRGFGFLHEITNRFPVQKYFLHVSAIKDGPCPPPLRSIVRFEPGPPRKAGELPVALNAFIVESEKTPAPRNGSAS